MNNSDPLRFVMLGTSRCGNAHARGAKEFLDPLVGPASCAIAVATATQQATLHHCSRYLRDFAIDFDGPEWRAVAVSVIDIRDLEAHVS